MSVKEAINEAVGERGATETLVNESVEIRIGGAGSTECKVVAIREPSMARVRKHIKILARGLFNAYQDIQGEQLLNDTVTELKAGKAPSDFGIGKLIESEHIAGALYEVIADVVGESRDYVDQEMTPKQVGKVLATYAKLVGWENLERFFVKAMTQGATLAEKMAEAQTEKPS